MTNPQTTSNCNPAAKLPMLPLSDHEHPCVYRPAHQARMPLLYPTRRLTGPELDEQLAAGRRRSGTYLYYTACPTCSACEPSRIEVSRFTPSRSMKRVQRLGDQRFRLESGLPRDDRTRVVLFNQHRLQRQLAVSNEAYTAEDFRGFLVDSCCDSRELSLWDQSRLIACTIVDCGAESISAVYTFFDPEYERYSLGTYLILKQLEWAREQGKRYLYLGMYVADNQHLRYKARFTPQERFIQGRWVPFETPMADWTHSSKHPASPPDPTGPFPHPTIVKD